MRWTTIHAIAAGAAVIFAQFGSPARAGDVKPVPMAAGEAPSPLVAPQSPSTFSPAIEETPTFVWSNDYSPHFTPYPTASAAESYLVPPSATATAIPLPPGAWTGFASLAGLGTISLLRHLRRAR